MWAQIVLLCLSASVGWAAIGQCPSPKVQADFDLEKLSGTWYIIEATASVDRVSRKCSTFIIEKKQGAKASMLHKFVSTVTDKWKSEYSDLTTPKKDEPAKLLVNPLKGTILARKYPLWVLDTDYDTHAILYSCHKLMLAYTEEIFILSRTKTIEDKKKTELYDVIKKKNLSQKNLVEVNQSEKDCKE
ncbi:lipocln_cytosolic_FA-bd_dom domain-containing protein [Trichonephila inaurata madagascariensis]|uniref:Lipocln_cytosolic_FA-bd_dom domain-containing protein n=1 Tax=Trichonephila inaurata madagascariensis TaxID=2747483 RepID=A0A8X7BSQ0_9ARAC|nr:lipocln_cytosolic_FA-bd_dom domain-containing protein [Trichonephila inaurata madagascariensis]